MATESLKKRNSIYLTNEVQALMEEQCKALGLNKSGYLSMLISQHAKSNQLVDQMAQLKVVLDSAVHKPSYCTMLYGDCINCADAQGSYGDYAIDCQGNRYQRKAKTETKTEERR